MMCAEVGVCVQVALCAEADTGSICWLKIRDGSAWKMETTAMIVSNESCYASS